MILPRTGADLPPWRRHVMPWLMAAVRALIAWFVLRDPLLSLVGKGAFVTDVAGRPIGWTIGTLLAVGSLLFVWPRTVLIGYAMLVAGVVAFELLWRRLGMPGGSLLATALGLFTVLAFGEWLVQRLQKRLYAPRSQ